MIRIVAGITPTLLLAILYFIVIRRAIGYEAALRFYADWLNYHKDPDVGKPKSAIEIDEGAKARKELGGKG